MKSRSDRSRFQVLTRGRHGPGSSEGPCVDVEHSPGGHSPGSRAEEPRQTVAVEVVWLGRSGSSAIPMVQPADLRDGDDTPHRGRLNVPRYRCIAAERAVGSTIVIVDKIRRDESSKVGFVQNNKMVQTFSTYASHDSLTIWILPR